MDLLQRGSPLHGDGCYCVLPGNVRLRSVVAVITRLLGSAGRVACVTSRPVGIGSAYVLCEAPRLAVSYHFESGRFDRRGRLLLLGPRQRAVLVALGMALVEFFGGTMVASDQDDVPILEVVPRTDSENCPDDEASNADLLERIDHLVPLSEDQLFRATFWSGGTREASDAR